LKLFKETSGSAIIRYYTNSASILIQGDEGKKLENILLEKTAKNQRLSEDSFSANNDESIEDETTNDLNSTITLQITTDSDLNDNQAFIEDLSSASESSILAEALAKGTNFESNTAMTDNSSQINGDEVNGVQVINTSPVHSCSCQQFATELVSLKYKIFNLQTTIFSFETTLKDHDTILSLYNRSSDLNEKYLREISESINNT
jgi:fructose-specific component phosphotransferase system IIB-like protein